MSQKGAIPVPAVVELRHRRDRRVIYALVIAAGLLSATIVTALVLLLQPHSNEPVPHVNNTNNNDNSINKPVQNGDSPGGIEHGSCNADPAVGLPPGLPEGEVDTSDTDSDPQVDPPALIPPPRPRGIVNGGDEGQHNTCWFGTLVQLTAAVPEWRRSLTNFALGTTRQTKPLNEFDVLLASLGDLVINVSEQSADRSALLPCTVLQTPAMHGIIEQHGEVNGMHGTGDMLSALLTKMQEHEIPHDLTRAFLEGTRLHYLQGDQQHQIAVPLNFDVDGEVHAYGELLDALRAATHASCLGTLMPPLPRTLILQLNRKAAAEPEIPFTIESSMLLPQWNDIDWLTEEQVASVVEESTHQYVLRAAALYDAAGRHWTALVSHAEDPRLQNDSFFIVDDTLVLPATLQEVLTRAQTSHLIVYSRVPNSRRA